MWDKNSHTQKNYFLTNALHILMRYICTKNALLFSFIEIKNKNALDHQDESQSLIISSECEQSSFKMRTEKKARHFRR